MKKNKQILISVLVGFIAFPTIVFGGGFVSSLIQGKTVEESIQVLAQQIDALIGRVELVESKQANLQHQVDCLELIKKTPSWGHPKK